MRQGATGPLRPPLEPVLSGDILTAGPDIVLLGTDPAATVAYPAEKPSFFFFQLDPSTAIAASWEPLTLHVEGDGVSSADLTDFIYGGPVPIISDRIASAMWNEFTTCGELLPVSILDRDFFVFHCTERWTNDGLVPSSTPALLRNQGEWRSIRDAPACVLCWRDPAIRNSGVYVRRKVFEKLCSLMPTGLDTRSG